MIVSGPETTRTRFRCAAFPSVQVVFAFIVAITLDAAGTCAGNDTISIMVTRRSTHASHAKPGGSSRRSSQRRSGAHGDALYAGGKKSARGGQVANVGGYASPGHSGGKSTRPSTRGSHTSRGVSGTVGPGPSSSSGVHRRNAPSEPSGVRVPTPNGEVLLTRRHFLFGALGVGALAAVGGGASVVIKQQQEAAADTVKVLEVPAASVTTSSSEAYTLVDDTASRISRVNSFELPYGTLVWASGDGVAACLLPNDEAKPLAKVGLLSLSSGNCPVVLDSAIGQEDGFDIYDVRATSSGLVWLEANIFEGVWRVYTARSDGATIGEARLVDEGDSNWETPSMAAVGKYAFWQVMPKADGNNSADDSLVKRATMGTGDAETVYTSHGRLCTAPYALKDSVVITPRAETTGTYYQLTHLDAASGNVLDTMVLPRAMRPLEAGYGDTGFTFSFEAIYNYGDGISGLGTYTPTTNVTDGDYSNAPWFCFNRVPTAPPAWCGPYFMVKSVNSVCGINFKTNEYFAIQPDDGAEDYGEYMASAGSNDTVVTYANIDYKPVDGEAKKYCLVSIWEPLA